MNQIIKELQSQGEELLASSLDDLVDGAKDDARIFYRDMAKDLAEAALIKNDMDREETVSEIRAQTKAMLELNRLRVVNESWELAEKLIAVTAKGIVMAGQISLTAATLAKNGGLL